MMAVIFITTSMQAQKVTLKSLLDEMASRDNIARWPIPEYMCKQTSSYDPKSVTPNAEDGKFVPKKGRDWGKGWFANHDFSNYIRTETNHGRKEDVIFDHQGPGAIVRMWNALGGKTFELGGIIRIYIDGNPNPVIEMHNRSLIGNNGLVGSPFSFCAPAKAENLTWRGRNMILPIPYQTSCKITFDGEHTFKHDKRWSGHYYQFNYRAYENGTKVESFTMENLNKLREYISETGKKLLNPETPETNKNVTKENIVIKPSKSYKIKLKGERAIKNLIMKLKSDNLNQALRSTVLTITFDGKERVWCPIGQFYGVGYEMHPHKTMYLEVTKDGLMKSMWTMPFKKKATLKIHNFGDQVVTLEDLSVKTSDWKWDDRSMYFNATWRDERNIETKVKRDGNYVTITGKGVYAGDNLTIFNTHPDWWGEGDEKIYVDGEKFPSHFGTGTEDYYSYAWCRPQVYSYPFISQPTGGGNKTIGMSSNNRYRALDAIPFNSSFHFDMEIWHPFKAKMCWSPATFWYAFPDTKHNIKHNPKDVKYKVPRKKEDVVD